MQSFRIVNAISLSYSQCCRELSLINSSDLNNLSFQPTVETRRRTGTHPTRRTERQTHGCVGVLKSEQVTKNRADLNFPWAVAKEFWAVARKINLETDNVMNFALSNQLTTSANHSRSTVIAQKTNTD